MSDFKVIDKDGTWYTNIGDFPLPDYGRAHGGDSGQDLLLLQPGVPTKIKASEYLLAQPMLQVLENDPISGEPISDEPIKVKAPAKAEAPK